jgi:hypothetical protein
MMNHSDKIEEENVTYINTIENALNPGGYLNSCSLALKLALSHPSGSAILKLTRDSISPSLFFTI